MSIRDKREAIAQRLRDIEAANGGRLTALAVVEDARNPDSPLHAQFQWDLNKAAYAHWLEQARTLIIQYGSAERIEKTELSAIYYVRDPSAGSKEQGYVSVTRLRGDQEMARAALVQEFSRAADFLRRAKQLAIVLNLDGDVDRCLEDVVGLRRLVMEQPQQTM